MNAVVWCTFALVVLVAPACAAGAGLLLGRAGRPAPVGAAVAVAAPAPLVPVEVPRPLDRPRVAVEPRPGNRWAVQKEGARRASRVFDHKDDAVAFARTLGDVAVAA